MSRIGRKTIRIPEDVEVTVNAGKILVKGPRGFLEERLPPALTAEIKDGFLHVLTSGTSGRDGAFWGLYRSLIANMVEGVTNGFRKELELSGIGFKVKKDDQALIFSLGYSHPIRYPSVPGISFEVEDETKLVVSGIDKRVVGEVASRIRELKKPEPYKGKGIKYSGEVIRRKAGKVGKASATLGK